MDEQGTHPGDDGRWALGGGVAAQSLVHTPALSRAPHTLIVGVSRQAQGTVTATKGAVVEGHCEEEHRGQQCPALPCPPPSCPTHPTLPTLEPAVNVLMVRLDVQVQRQCLIGIVGQLGDKTQGHTAFPSPAQRGVQLVSPGQLLYTHIFHMVPSLHRVSRRQCVTQVEDCQIHHVDTNELHVPLQWRGRDCW